MGCPLPADRHVKARASLSACTEILRFAQDDSSRLKGNPVTQAPSSGGNPA